MGSVILIVILYMWIKFIRRVGENKRLLNQLSIDPTLATRSGYLSVGFLVATAISAFPIGPIRYLLVPVPIVILFCVPGVIALAKLGLRFERAGTDKAKPAKDWVDSGKIAGWVTIGFCVIQWVFSLAPLLLGSSITN